MNLISEYTYKDKLETERLITRFLVPDDVKVWTKFFTYPDAIKLFPDFGLKTPEEKANHWIEKQFNRYQDKKYGMQVLLDKKTGEFIGQCGLLSQEIDGASELEVGYHIFPTYWGKGYAPEAAAEFLKFGFEHNQSESIISIIDTRNKNSQRVADKNKLIQEKSCTWNGLNVYVYRIRKNQFYEK